MAKLSITYNNSDSIDIGLSIMKRVVKPSPVMQYEEKTIPGGTNIYIEKGYGDIEITVPFNFVSKNADDWDEGFRKAKKWLLSKTDNKLIFSDDTEIYYKVKKVTIENPERVMKRLGRFEVKFICDPYSHLLNGITEISPTITEIYNSDTWGIDYKHGVILNDYEECYPIIHLINNTTYYKNYNFSINNNNITMLIQPKDSTFTEIKPDGSTFSLNDDGERFIDVEKGVVYLKSGHVANRNLTGYFEDMKLNKGEVHFDYPANNDVTFTLKPNWRCL